MFTLRDIHLFSILQAVDSDPLSMPNNWPILVKSLGQFFFYVFAFVFVIALAFAFTKWLASAKYLKKGDSNIQVLESVVVGVGSSIQLIRTGKKYFVIAVSKERVSFLTEVNEEDLSFHDEDTPNNLNFEKYLGKFLINRK